MTALSCGSVMAPPDDEAFACNAVAMSSSSSMYVCIVRAICVDVSIVFAMQKYGELAIWQNQSPR